VEEASPDWDDDVAAALMDALVLIGITRVDGDNQSIGQEQFFGRVVTVDSYKGIKLRLEGSREGQEYNLPPDTSAFQKAAPGEYRLRGTGEVVTNPDFTTSWTINEPNPE
jgi:hypothetical protein